MGDVISPLPTAARAISARGELRRAKLLAAAEREFLAHGYGGATLRNIVKGAGGSPDTLYQYFGDKEGLFNAIVQSIAVKVNAAFDKRGAFDREPDQALLAFGQNYMKVMMGKQALAFFRIVMAEAARFPELGAKVYKIGPGATATRLANYLSLQVERGRLDIAEPDLAARHFLEIIKGDLHLRALYMPDNVPTHEEIDHCVRLAVSTFLRGVERTTVNAATPHVSRQATL